MLDDGLFARDALDCLANRIAKEFGFIGGSEGPLVLVVAAGPPLKPEQRDRLALLLRPTSVRTQ